MAGLVIPVPGSETGIDFGAFISAIINFFIIALVVFFLVKAVNKLQDVGKKACSKEEEAKPAEPEMNPPVCCFCLEEVKEGATRCPHCTAELPAPAAPTPKE